MSTNILPSPPGRGAGGEGVQPRLKAPNEHGQILAVPPLDQVDVVFFEPKRKDAASHSKNLPTSNTSPWPLARAQAREEVLRVSSQYHAEAGEAIPDGGFTFVAGHQPELFHPGVWFKNFVLQHLARKHGGNTLNLIIDTDTPKPPVLHAPDDGRIARIPFDRTHSEAPYEERIVEDEQMFAHLPERMASIVGKWKFEPMLAMFWDEVMKQAKRTPLLGERFASARRAVERRWGFVQREVPMSRLCRTRAFAEFALLFILGDLRRFHATYNAVVQAYRQEHGIRSRSHPVPNLATDGDWLEAPFWAWRQGQTRREKLFSRRTAAGLELRVAGEAWPTLPHGFDPFLETWLGLESHGYKIRTRALTTTMFARLLLAEVFVHGIGGGIYDELTDRILESLEGFKPPPYLIVSATLLLPLPRFADANLRHHELQRRLRDLRYKPERFLEDPGVTEPLIRDKAAWISRTSASTHAKRVERFKQIRAINAQLAPIVQAKVTAAQRDLDECRRQMEWNGVSARRDYAFCLYPEAMLRDFFATPRP